MLEKVPEIVKDTNVELDELAILVAKEIRSEQNLTSNQKRDLLSLVRKWAQYAEENKIDQADELSIRYHLLEFSKKNFTNNTAEDFVTTKIESVSIERLKLPDGSLLRDYINKNFQGEDIFNDEHVAIYGGIARLALKVYASQNDKSFDLNLLNSELPINDIDIVVDDKDIASKYKSGIAGTRVVTDIQEYTKMYYQTVDCTINQVLIYNGELLFTDDALKDNTNGELHFIEKKETLFNPDSVVLEDGKTFVTGKGFYRALSYLLRHKAHRLSLYKDNLDFLRNNKYSWAAPLPKILLIKNTEMRNRSINEWYCLAKKLEFTNSKNPDEFLQEIILGNGEIVNYNFKTEDSNAEEIRWIITHFLKSGARSVAPDKHLRGMNDELVDIDMREIEYEGHDLRKFFERINSTFRNANFD